MSQNPQILCIFYKQEHSGIEPSTMIKIRKLTLTHTTICFPATYQISSFVLKLSLEFNDPIWDHLSNVAGASL